MREEASVVVVGLGPVGAVLAGLLGSHGVDVIAVERSPDVFPLPRAAHIDHTGLRAIQGVGCLDELLPEMIENPGLDLVTRDGGLLMRIPGVQPNPSNLPASMYFHQPTFDATLRRAAGAMPSVELRVGWEVVAVEQDVEGAVVRAVAQDGREHEVQGRYVVAADGASSVVRELLGISLIDLEFHERWLVVDLYLREPVPSLPDRAVTYCDPERPLGYVPMPGRRCRFELMLMEGEDSETMQQQAVVEQLVSRWITPGVAEVERAAVYTFHGLLAEPWSTGAVLLAGDAAHLMPPFLGQGMNSGLRDSSNLAWKLAAVVHGQAPESLLATYELERKPHIRSVIESSVRIGKVVCTLDPEEAARRNELFLADPGAAAEVLSFGLSRLQPGPLVLKGGGDLSAQAINDDGIGRFDDVIGNRFFVLARKQELLEGAAGRWWADELGALTGTPQSFPGYTTGLSSWLDRLDTDIAIVRPDRYVLGTGTHLEPLTHPVRSLLLAARAGAQT